jgi:Acetyltransferase (GNAT) family
MPRYVALLCGVNPVNAKMADLKACFEKACYLTQIPILIFVFRTKPNEVFTAYIPHERGLMFMNPIEKNSAKTLHGCLGHCEGMRRRMNSEAAEIGNEFVFKPVIASDGDDLGDLKADAMRESLQSIGRFDAARALAPFLDSFTVRATKQICLEGKRVGFMVVREDADHIHLDHFLVVPEAQNKGIGSAAINEVLRHAE